MEIRFLLVLLYFICFFVAFSKEGEGFFAAASFMSFQQCHFNFGIEPFRYPPTKRKYKSFNQFGHIELSDKVIIIFKMNLLRAILV